jgi:hypothetical protein
MLDETPTKEPNNNLKALTNKTYSTSEDEYDMSDIELTDELIAVLDKTYCESEDDYPMSDIELTDDLIAVLDKNW